MSGKAATGPTVLILNHVLFYWSNVVNRFSACEIYVAQLGERESGSTNRKDQERRSRRRNLYKKALHYALEYLPRAFQIEAQKVEEYEKHRD